jgi:hypothetical protein
METWSQLALDAIAGAARVACPPGREPEPDVLE